MDIKVTPTTPVRLLRIKEVSFLTGLPKSSVYDLMSRQLFPRSVSLPGGKSVAWSSSEINQWIVARIAARDTDKGAA
jgi:prophage regulatory protein